MSAQKEDSCSSRALSAWLAGAARFEHFLEDCFESLGRGVGRRPRATLLFVFFVSLVGLAGLSQLSAESRGDRLWTPQSSVPLSHKSFIQSISTFGAPPRYEETMVASKSNSNILTIAGVTEMMNVWQSLLDLRVDRGPGVTPDSVEDLCVKLTLPGGAKGPCLLSDSIIDFWNANKTLFTNSISTESQLLSAVSAETFPDGRQVNRANTFGLPRVDGSNQITFASAGNINFLLQEELEDRSKAWEQAAIDMLLSRRDALEASGSDLTIVVRYQRSLDDELARSVTGDIPLLITTYTLMSVFVCLTLGKVHRVYGRIALSLGGILMIVLATGASFGFCSLAGVKFISIHQVLPFILVGIGVDDMYIIVAAFNLTNKKLDTAERIAQTLRNAGITVTVTSLTNALAFALGSTSIIPAVEFFCLYASFSVVMIYSFGMTAFCAMLVLDEERQRDNRLDCCCCFVSKQRKRQDDISMASSAVELVAAPTDEQVATASASGLAADANGDINKSGPAAGVADAKLSWSARFMRDKYAPWLLDPRVKVGVAVVFLGFLALNIYWVTELTQGFELVDLTPDESYARDYFEAEEVYFPDRQLGLSLYFRDLQYHTTDVQQEVQAFTNMMLASPWTLGPVTSWLTEYQAFYRSTAAYNSSLDSNNLLTDKTLFYQGLNAFLQLPSSLIFNSNVHWSDATRTSVTASKISLFHVPLPTSEDQKNMLLDLRDLALSSPLNANTGGKDANAFPYSPAYVFFESYVTIYSELVFNFILSGVAVICICLILLAHPGSIPFLVAVIAMIDADLLGCIQMWGLQINSVTAVQLIMATGLIVDYSAHVTHSFLKHSGTRDERVHKALTSMGSSIVMGGTTSFLGVLPLVVSTSTIFRTFFRMFFCIVLYGLLHGLLLLPVLLSWAGPELPHSLKNGQLEQQAANTSSMKNTGAGMEVKSDAESVAEE